jgi:hypothetical protein
MVHTGLNLFISNNKHKVARSTVDTSLLGAVNWLAGPGPARERDTGSATLLSLLNSGDIRLSAVDTLKRYSKALEYEYRVKPAALGTLK